jgi:hypothetical protein
MPRSRICSPLQVTPSPVGTSWKINVEMPRATFVREAVGLAIAPIGAVVAVVAYFWLAYGRIPSGAETRSTALRGLAVIEPE